MHFIMALTMTTQAILRMTQRGKTNKLTYTQIFAACPFAFNTHLMHRTTRFLQQSARRAYTTESTDNAAKKLAEQALAAKTGGARSKATLPKGDKKPAKAAGEKNDQWKNYALGAGAVTGLSLGSLFYYGNARFVLQKKTDR